MPKSDRDPAVLAREREARLAARMAKQYLASGAVEAAMGYLQQVLADPSCPKRTRVQAAKTLVANAAKISSKKTQLQLDGAVTSLSMADLLALADASTTRPEIPNNGSAVSPELQAGGSEGVPAFTATQQGDALPRQPVTAHAGDTTPETTEAPPLPSDTQTPTDAPLRDERKEDPTEGAGSTTPSEEAAS